MAKQRKTPPPEGIGAILGTMSGPAGSTPADRRKEDITPERHRRIATQKDGQAALAEAMPANPLKASEYGTDNARRPKAGDPVAPLADGVTGSTVTEDTGSAKLGEGSPPAGNNRTITPLDAQRVDSGGQALTTNQGVAVADNQNSLKAGLRGPVLLEDFVLREKIMHFDHERIPERVVHARGSGAHGYFECYDALDELTMAAPFAEAGKQTPVFVRFSTVAGERGSADTVRDVRGFAVKFYTDAGNWDLVGNNIPVFFIQDGHKFPDLVHSFKPEPHFAMPQASTAHDTFWDFASLMPESTHMLLWIMSDRAIPRSYRTMQGFGVHTFRFVNAKGESRFVKFHWNPLAGTHSLVWDEAVKINGADPDFHRRDLWESIESGAFPEYELAVQVFTEEEAESFPFDVLDATKIVPEELVPLKPVGRLVLNRNPDNFFAETEQVAFCTANVVPGIDFSNDPLLQARNFSYLDTQLLRLGGPNFQQIPINAPVVQVHNNQRDGFHQHAIHRGRVNYEPNSLGGGCPFQAGMRGFTSFPEPMFEDKVRGKPEKFADHYSQARLFWQSQSDVEKNHIVAAFRFELTRVQTPAVRERVVSLLANVNDELAGRVADGLGFAVPDPQPPVLAEATPADLARVERSPALSLLHRPGTAGVLGRRVAILLTDECECAPLQQVYARLADAGAVPRYVGERLGSLDQADADAPQADITLEAAPSALWDAVVVPHRTGIPGRNGQLMEFVRDQYRHCKPLLVLGNGTELLTEAGIPILLEHATEDPGLVAWFEEGEAADGASGLEDAVTRFMAALAAHRHYDREEDPPRV